MNDKSLYELAVEMLETTNPYSKPVEKNLLKRVENNLKNVNKSVHKTKADKINSEYCFSAISEALVNHIEKLENVSFSFQQVTKEKYKKWLEDIDSKYNAKKHSAPEELKIKPNERDTAITILKLLHSRKGLSTSDLANEMDISQRAVQKALLKLDPDLYKGDKASPDPFRIGGHPITAKITEKPIKRDNAPLYFTENTVHPLILMENQMQIGTLLLSLANLYSDYYNETALTIGLDIWCQLSEYSKIRVREYFAYNNPNLKKFIEKIENITPADFSGSQFRTEREMFTSLNSDIPDRLPYVMKGRGRKCNLQLFSQSETLVAQTVDYYINEDKEIIYTATGNDGTVTEFNEDDIEYIEIENMSRT
ncbi:MAG: hypothetical protein Q4C42_11995 [Clostridia bacterium]|nr:hypothetical protein [Clostridia bacterium]